MTPGRLYGGTQHWFIHSSDQHLFAGCSPNSGSFFTDSAGRHVKVKWHSSLTAASIALEHSMLNANGGIQVATKAVSYEKIEDQSQVLERVDPGEVARALDAEEFASAKVGGPFSMWTIRSRLLSDIVSTGGRPARRGASLRKIPVTDAEWATLDEIVGLLKHQGVNATPGQVAGLLLSQSLVETLRRLDSVSPSAGPNQPAANPLSDAELEETLETILTAAAKAEVHLEELRPVAFELLRRMRNEKGGAGR